MPYIKKSIRHQLLVGQRRPQSAGELQYIMAELFKQYLHEQGLRYQTLNDVMGALSGAQQEFYLSLIHI